MSIILVVRLLQYFVFLGYEMCCIFKSTCVKSSIQDAFTTAYQSLTIQRFLTVQRFLILDSVWVPLQSPEILVLLISIANLVNISYHHIIILVWCIYAKTKVNLFIRQMHWVKTIENQLSWKSYFSFLKNLFSKTLLLVI